MSCDTPRDRQAKRSTKITRAIKHLAELEALLADYVASQPAMFQTAQQKISETETRIFYHCKIKPVPEESSAILGDIIHNLRASLDLMAAELARVTSGTDDGVYFPFAKNPNDLDLMIKKRNFDKCGSDAVALLKEFAAHKGQILLRALHDLDIQDKHRSIIPVGAWVGPSEVDFVFPNGGPLGDIPLIPTLHDLVNLTDSVIEAFAAMLAARA